MIVADDDHRLAILMHGLNTGKSKSVSKIPFYDKMQKISGSFQSDSQLFPMGIHNAADKRWDKATKTWSSLSWIRSESLKSGPEIREKKATTLGN